MKAWAVAIASVAMLTGCSSSAKAIDPYMVTCSDYEAMSLDESREYSAAVADIVGIEYDDETSQLISGYTDDACDWWETDEKPIGPHVIDNIGDVYYTDY